MARGLYTEELGRKIAAKVEEGETLTAAGRAHGVKPSTVHQWMRHRASFQEMVNTARGDKPKYPIMGPHGVAPTHTPEMLDSIVERVTEGEPLHRVAEQAGITLTTVYRWEKEIDGFRERMLSARQAYAHSLVAESLEIADDESQDIIERDGKVHFNSTKIKRDQLRVQTRWRTAAAFNPEAYGERKGGAGGVQVNITLNTEDRASIERYLEIADSIPGEPVED